MLRYAIIIIFFLSLKLKTNGMRTMITPPILKSGDTIGLVSTARKITPEELQPAIDCLSDQGYKVVLAPNLCNQLNQFAGTDSQRAADLQWMIDQPEIKAILCTRGGYGTVRIVDAVDFSPLLQNPKWICGYSDVTVLHAHLNTLGIKSLHCTMPINFPADGSVNESVKTMLGFLQGMPKTYEIPAQLLNRPGKANGELVGGNLSILYSIQGSVSALDTEGKVLFIEDLDEYIYHIDRMMINLKRSGKLSKLAGLIVGGMSDMHDNTVPFGKTAEEIIHDAVAEFDYPVCFGFPAGHIDPNLALLMGGNVSLNVSEKKSTITFI
jgi:muramoyltetrapeptide carboxypeptidase